jgi:hypothetical protein
MGLARASGAIKPKSAETTSRPAARLWLLLWRGPKGKRGDIGEACGRVFGKVPPAGLLEEFQTGCEQTPFTRRFDPDIRQSPRGGGEAGEWQ